MYNSTSTFKTRRKHQLLLLTCWAILVHNVASMAVPISCPEFCECYLNNNGLQSARCSEMYMNQTEFPNIHVLVLRGSGSQDQCDISKDFNVIFPQLNYLYATNCSLTSIPERAFETLKYLQEIDLSHNFIETIDSSTFVNNTKLIYANLQNNPLRLIDNEPFLISNSINELDLSSCSIKRLPRKMFKSLPKLKYLTLRNNELSTIAKDTLPEGVKILNLGKNQIKHVPIAELERLSKLSKIDLSENPINCTCSTLSFQNHLSGKSVLLLNNGMECVYPLEHRGKQSAHVPYMEICMAELAALKPDQDEGNKGLRNNEISPEEKSDKKKHKKGKKDNIQDDFERDEVVPYNKKAYVDEMQSDSDPDEGSGDGGSDASATIVGETKPPTDEETKPTPKSDYQEDNKTKQDGSSTPAVLEASSTANQSESTKNSDVTFYKKELDITETTTNPVPPTEPQKPINETEPGTQSPPSSTEAPKPKSETPSSESPRTNPATSDTSSERLKIESEPAVPSTESTKLDAKITSTSETSQPAPEITASSPPAETSASTSDTPTEPKTEPTVSSNEPPVVEILTDTTSHVESKPEPKTESIGSSTETPSPVVTTLPINTSHVESSVSHALQKDDSNTFNLGYIIPCLAILIVIIICLGIYLSQRSSHKNWEPAAANDGAELQDVSLLPENNKMPIVKNKYPAEGNSEQTEKLMNDSNSSAPKSVWEHFEEPFENGNSVYPKDSDKLPNGQSVGKNEPIECAIAKVTTLPDSIPRTPLIRNT